MAEDENSLDISGALIAVASIMQLVKRSPEGQERKNLKLADKKIKQLRRKLKKDGFEDWEKQLLDDLTKAYAEQLKKLMK